MINSASIEFEIFCLRFERSFSEWWFSQYKTNSFLKDLVWSCGILFFKFCSKNFPVEECFVIKNFLNWNLIILRGNLGVFLNDFSFCLSIWRDCNSQNWENFRKDELFIGNSLMIIFRLSAKPFQIEEFTPCPFDFAPPIKTLHLNKS